MFYSFSKSGIAEEDLINHKIHGKYQEKMEERRIGGLPYRPAPGAGGKVGFFGKFQRTGFHALPGITACIADSLVGMEPEELHMGAEVILFNRLLPEKIRTEVLFVVIGEYGNHYRFRAQCILDL
jgi:hypothetical protein